MRVFWLAALLAMIGAAEVSAADLSKVERTIRKEPKYEYQPKYTLLVFGPKAEQRVWVVLDAVADPADPYKKILGCLYVDRNGNGDLTEEGKCVKIKPGKQIPLDFEHVIVDSTDGKTKYKLAVGAIPCFDPRSEVANREGKFVKVEPNLLVQDVTSKRWFGIRTIEDGAKVYGSSPKEAPVAQIDGPLQMGFEVAKAFSNQGNGQYELAVGVVTPGSSKGIVTFLCHWNNAIPEGVHPAAILEFPNAKQGGPPVRVEAVLKQRC